MTWSPDGAALITFTTRGEIFVRDAETGRERFPPIRLPLENGVCTASDISSDNELLLATNWGAFEVWYWRQSRLLLPRRQLDLKMAYQYGGSRLLKVSPDGRFAMIGGTHASKGIAAYVLTLDDLNHRETRSPDELINLAEVLAHERLLESGATSNLTLDEWLERWRKVRVGAANARDSGTSHWTKRV